MPHDADSQWSGLEVAFEPRGLSADRYYKWRYVTYVAQKTCKPTSERECSPCARLS
jgi:hypothetical protein